MKLKHRLFRVATQALVTSGAACWLAPIACGRGLILAFHRVCPQRQRAFEPLRYLSITPDYLERIIQLTRAQGFQFVSLDEVPERVAKPKNIPFVALTFDDGYRDNLNYAMPILARHGVPWTVFITASFAAGWGRLWWFELQEAVTRLERVELQIGSRAFDLPARQKWQKQRAFDILYNCLGASPDDTRLRALADLARSAHVNSTVLLHNLCLSWNEVAELSRKSGVTMGAHTITHPSLARLPREVAASEIRGSRDILENRLGIEIRHFAFPFGGPLTTGPREFALARDAGFRTAVTTRPGHLLPEHGPCLHALPRVQISGLFQTDAALRAILSGAPFFRSRRYSAATRTDRREHSQRGVPLGTAYSGRGSRASVRQPPS